MLVIVILLQTSFSENVVVAKTSYQMLGILSFSDEERALRLSTRISELTAFVAKKKFNYAFWVSIFREEARKS